MKKVLSVVIALVIALSSLAVFAFAADTPVLSIKTNTESAKVGDIVKADVVVSENSDLCVVTIDFVYDADCFEVVSMTVNENAFGGGIVNANYAKGKAKYAAAQVAGLTKEATLFTVELKVVKTGGKLSLDVSEAYVAVDGNDNGRDVTEDVAKEAAKISVEIACSHANKKEMVIKPATCDETGLKVEMCQECDWESENVEIPATGHVAGEWEVIKEATETETGEKVKKCTACGEVVETEEIPVLPEFMLGDVNCDGQIKALDVRYILQYAAEMRELNEVQLMAADVNGDGKVNSLDARWLLQVLALLRTL